jgi:protein TonB
MKRCWFFVIAGVVLVSVFSAAQQSGGEGAGSTPNAPKSDTGPPQRVRVSQGVSTSLLIKKVAPQYPDDAKQARIQGSVVLQALIDKNGDVADLALVSGHPMLAPAAIKAVKQWKYKPYLLNGQPVNVETQIVVRFSLSGG